MIIPFSNFKTFFSALFFAFAGLTPQMSFGKTYDLDSMIFLKIEPATFWMGAPKDQPWFTGDNIEHPATLTYSFEILSTEVTTLQFVQLMLNQSFYRVNPEFCPDYSYKYYLGQGFCAGGPALNVRYSDAVLFAQRLTRYKNDGYVYRLPTEAEWELASRAGTRTRFFWGDSLDSLDEYAWTARNYDFGFTVGAPVGLLKPNPLGLLDIVGNALEWVQDYYAPFTEEAVINPTGPATAPDSLRVIRGPSMVSGLSIISQTGRGKHNETINVSNIGFRLVRVPK